MSQLQMSLGDVAALARVERPVASVWRRRHADSVVPFPEPVGSTAGEELVALREQVAELSQLMREREPHGDTR